MSEQKALWGWFPAGNVWVKLQVDANGRLVLDPTLLFDDTPDNLDLLHAPTSNWAFNHNDDPDAHHARLHTMTDVLDHTGRIALTQMTLGGAGLVLTGQGAGDPIYAAAGGFNEKVKSETRVLNAVAGDVAYTGYGFQPKCLIILAAGVGDILSWGFADAGASGKCIYRDSDTTGGLSTSVLIWEANTTPIGQKAILKTLDADGFTLTWTIVGAGLAFTGTFIVLALG